MLQQSPASETQSFRLDVPLHNLLTQQPGPPPRFQPKGEPQQFPDPVFPQRPELFDPIDFQAPFTPPEKRHWTASQIYHISVVPRVMNGSFAASTQ